MSEKEKKILETIAKALPNMDSFDKGYFLGVAESKVKDKKRGADDGKTGERIA